MEPSSSPEPSELQGQGSLADQRFSLVWDVSADAMALSDADGVVLDVNPAYCELYGYLRDEFVGQDFARIFSPGERTQARLLYQQVFTNPAPPNAYETVIQRADGTHRTVESRIDFLLQDGVRVAMLSSIRDITERVRLAEDLRLLAEASQVLAGSLDNEETLERVARLAVPGLADWASLHLRTAEDQIAPLALVHPGLDQGIDLDALRRRYAREAGPGTPLHRAIFAGVSTLFPEVTDDFLVANAHDEAHLAFLRSQGFRSLMVVPLMAGAEPVGALTLVTAGSGRRYEAQDLALAEELGRRGGTAVQNARLYREAQEAREQRAHFFSFAAHELRGPLSSIQAFSELIRDEQLPMGEVKEFSHAIHQEGQRISRLVGDLLDLESIDAGRLALQLQRMDLNALIAELVDNYGAQGLPHVLRLELDSALPLVEGDRDRLAQMMRNLLSNALKYSPEGGEVTVGTAHEGERVRLRVSDEGVGIPEEELDRIFERYTRVAAEDHPSITGLGLGLPIVRHIAALHGGRVWADSELGHGSTFHLTLPLPGDSQPSGSGTPHGSAQGAGA